jgi:uncharacterized ion transporter superfamily protein YfcC
MKLSRLKAPNTFLIIFLLIIVAAILTWIIPAGEFETTLKNGREIVVSGSYHTVDENPQGIFDVLTAPIDGFVDAALIIGFVLIVGGAFGVFTKTEAVDSGIKAIAKAHSTSPVVRKLLIPIFMTLFSIGGSVFGMGEEVIPFILIFVPMALMLGYDSITGVAIPFVGAGAGFAGAFINPFTIGIAQGIAELPPLSGIEYRVVVWFIITAAAIYFVMKHAEKVKTNPELSPTFELDKKKKENLQVSGLEKFEGIDAKHKLVLILFLMGLIVLVWGVIFYGWYIAEISAVFFATGIIVGIAGKLTVKEITDSFLKGAKDLMPTALIIALARGILIIATDGKIIDTILYAASNPIDSLHPVISSQAMFVVQSFLNFFIPSGSGQAALTMPIMAPLGDLIGVSRQTAVLAYQFGDGFTNLIIPTSAITMGVLTLAEIQWDTWAKWMIKLQVVFILLGLILLIPPYFIW